MGAFEIDQELRQLSAAALTAPFEEAGRKIDAEARMPDSREGVNYAAEALIIDTAEIYPGIVSFIDNVLERHFLAAGYNEQELQAARLGALSLLGAISTAAEPEVTRRQFGL